MHVWFNHFNHALLVAVRCEANRASEATPTVAEASEASGSYYISITIVQSDTGKYHEFGAYSIITSA